MKKLIFLSGIMLFYLGCKAPAVKIGIILPEEGPASIYGKSALKGVNLAIEKIKGEKVFGKKIEFVLKNNKGLMNITKEIMVSFGKDKDVICVVGPLISQNAFIAASVSQKYFLPVISPTATHPMVTRIGDFVYRVTFNDSIQGIMLAKFVYKNLKKKNAAILYNADNPYSKTLSRNFEIFFKELGGEVLTSEFFWEKDTAFYSKLEKIKFLNPDVLFLPVYSNYVPIILKEALKMDFKKVIFVGSDGWFNQDLINNNKDIFKELIAYISSPFAPNLSSERVREFVEKYKDRYGEIPDFCSALTYDAVMIVYDVLKRMKGLKRDEFLKELNKLEFDGITGNISFRGKRDPVRDVFILKVSPEGFKYFTTVSP